MKRVVTLAVVLLSSSIASAQQKAPSPSWEADAEAYCRYVVGAGNAESDLLLAPSVFGTFGVVNGADQGSSSLPPVTRLIVGGSFNVASFTQGLWVRRRAEADCARQRVVSQLHAFTEANEDDKSKSAQGAKLKVLEAALPRAKEILASTKAALAVNRATLDELNATQLRVEALRTALDQAKLDLESASGLPASPKESVTSLIAAHAEAEEKVERYEARVRESKGWDLILRGGYDRVFNVRDYTPLFGTVTLSLNLGLFFAPFSNEDAIAGRRAWAATEIRGVDDRARVVALRLKATHCAEKSRLKEQETLLADVLAREKAVGAIGGGDKAKSVTEYLFFEHVRLEAEVAYLRAHVADLDATLGAGSCAQAGEKSAD